MRPARHRYCGHLFLLVAVQACNIPVFFLRCGLSYITTTGELRAVAAFISANLQPQVGWLGLRVGGRRALCLHSPKEPRVNFRNDSGHDEAP